VNTCGKVAPALAPLRDRRLYWLATALTAKFMPIVTRATDKLGLAQQYNADTGKGARFGLVKAKDANIASYVTQKTLDGLFLMIGEEERAIRGNPLGQASSLSKKVFGANGTYLRRRGRS